MIIDDIMSRLASIGDQCGTYAVYKYLGAGRIVEEDYSDIDVKLSYLDSNGNFTGLDRFGRVAEQVWTDYGASRTWCWTIIATPTSVRVNWRGVCVPAAPALRPLPPPTAGNHSLRQFVFRRGKAGVAGGVPRFHRARPGI